MPSWAKTKLIMVGGIAGVGGGLGWHIMTVYADPPRITIYLIEAGLVAILIGLNAGRKTPHSPNFNLIPTLTRCPLA